MPHSYTVQIAHVVFATKDRTALIKPAFEERLYPYIGGIVRELGGRLYTINGAEDHVHLLAALPASLAMSAFVGSVKGSSSRWTRETFPSRRSFRWQRGYAAFSVSQSRTHAVARYIERQKEHHKRLSFQDEYMKLLEAHGIEVDPRCLWT